MSVRQESVDTISGRLPVKRTKGEMIVFAVVNSRLLFKIFKRVKRMRCIKILVILATGTLDLAVMPGV